MNEESTRGSGQVPPQPREVRVLDAAALRRWLVRAADGLRRHRGRIDALNVYPVPDGDTGTNLHLTLDGALTGLLRAFGGHGEAGRSAPVGIAAGLSALARACLLEARGNSGVILSQFVAGLAGVVADHPEVDVEGVDADALTSAFEEADRRARAAVVEPVEGTILTVMRAAARAARRAREAGVDSVSGITGAAVAAARTALAETPSQLPELAQAGVVDAGGAGLLVVLEALADVAHGRPSAAGPAIADPDPSEFRIEPEGTRGPALEVMYLVEGLDDAAAAELTARLAGLGTSLVVAGDAQVRSVHVHTDDAGAAVEAVLDLGRPYGVRIGVLTDEARHGTAEHDALEVDAAVHDRAAHDRAAHDRAVHDAAGQQRGAVGPGPTPGRTDRAVDAGESGDAFGVVACVCAPALGDMFRAAGVHVVEDSPRRRATPAQLLDAVRRTGCRTVVVLPDDGDVLMSAGLAAEVAASEGIDVQIVPTVHLVQGLAAVAVMDRTGTAGIAAMRAAAEAVSHGVVVTATAQATTAVGECRAGDVLGFVGGRIAHVARDRVQVAVDVVRDLAATGGELVTLVEGDGHAGLGDAVSAALLRAGVDVDVDVHFGGQSVYDLLVGVE